MLDCQNGYQEKRQKSNEVEAALFEATHQQKNKSHKKRTKEKSSKEIGGKEKEYEDN